MKLLSLAENTALPGLKAVHGLALYIQTRQHKLLFDLGPDDTLFHNATQLGIDLGQIDTVILSHGHYDHGGALGQFLAVNHTARVYVQRAAFHPHFSVAGGAPKFIGLDPALAQHPQVVLLEGDAVIDEELQVFVVEDPRLCPSEANLCLHDSHGPDPFRHEQNLIVTEETVSLIMGCGHTGVVNILAKAAPFHPTLCVGGFHLHNPTTGVCIPHTVLDEIATHLQGYPQIRFHTCHCTGAEAYVYLAERLPGLHYLSCGQSL